MRILSFNCNISEIGVVVVDYNAQWKEDILALLTKKSSQYSNVKELLTEIERVVDNRIKIVFATQVTLYGARSEKYAEMLSMAACLKGMLDDVTAAFPNVDSVLVRYYDRSCDADRISAAQITAYFVAPCKSIKMTSVVASERGAASSGDQDSSVSPQHYPRVVLLDVEHVARVCLVDTAAYTEKFSAKAAREKHALANFEEFMRRHSQPLSRKNCTYVVAVAFLQCYAWVIREFEL